MLLYQIFIKIYYAIILIISPFNSKAKLWLNGRKKTFEIIENLNTNKKTIWVHCSSLGEFEQGRPLIEQLKMKYPHIQVILTFFSPSGYEIRKNYKYADCICYLPHDTIKNSTKFINKINPSLVIFIKYDLWFNYIKTIQQRNIPFILISAVFRKNQYFFKWYGKAFLKYLQNMSAIFVQDNNSYQLLKLFSFDNVYIAGDTRIDRVCQIAENNWSDEIIEKFTLNKNKIIICGSTWKKDEKILYKLKNKYKNISLIIAPHQINENHLNDIKKLFLKNKITFYTQTSANEASNFDILVIDKIGILSSLYRYGHIAYVGGGFGKSIHNILEPAAYGIPIIFGPNYKKFIEAIELVKTQGAFPISNYVELEKTINYLFFEDNYKKKGNVCKNYIYQQKGATIKIMEILKNYLQ